MLNLASPELRCSAKQIELVFSEDFSSAYKLQIGGAILSRARNNYINTEELDCQGNYALVTWFCRFNIF